MMKPAIIGGIVRVEHRLGADHLRDHAAAIDVADEDHGYVGGAAQTPYWRCRRCAG